MKRDSEITEKIESQSLFISEKIRNLRKSKINKGNLLLHFLKNKIKFQQCLDPKSIRNNWDFTYLPRINQQITSLSIQFRYGSPLLNHLWKNPKQSDFFDPLSLEFFSGFSKLKQIWINLISTKVLTKIFIWNPMLTKISILRLMILNIQDIDEFVENIPGKLKKLKILSAVNSVTFFK